MPKSQAAVNQEEEKKDKHKRVQNKQTDAREARRPVLSSQSQVITMLQGLEKKKDKEQRARQG